MGRGTSEWRAGRTGGRGVTQFAKDRRIPKLSIYCYENEVYGAASCTVTVAQYSRGPASPRRSG
eukprot:3079042-Prymnesium_polylepis.1